MNISKSGQLEVNINMQDKSSSRQRTKTLKEILRANVPESFDKPVRSNLD